MGVHWAACVCACTCRCRFVCECMHSNVTGLCNWNGNEPISSVVCLLTLRTLHSSSSPKFTLSVCDSVCECLSLSLSACVGFSCVFVMTLRDPSVFRPRGPEESVWKCNQLVIKITYLSLAQPFRNMHTHTSSHALHPVDFPGFVLWPTAHWDSCALTMTCNYHQLAISLLSNSAP